MKKSQIQTSDDFHNFTLELLSLLNNIAEKNDIIKEILYKIKKFTDIDAVGIRIRKGVDYPYYETMGFNQDFVNTENTLCVKDDNGEQIKDCQGEPVFGCLCGIIIQGRVDSFQDFFTEGGSFWTSCSSSLNLQYFKNKFPFPFRFNCVNNGYESIALIPIYVDGEVIGLLQLNHKMKAAFNLNMIKEFEKLANIIGVILKRKELETEIVEQKATLEYNELKTKFFSRISHEFRTPISLIFSVLKMIDIHNEKYNKGESKSKIKKYLSILKKNNSRLLKLINNLIDLMEIDAGSFKLNIENNDIVKLVADLTDSVKMHIKGNRTLNFSTGFSKKIIACDSQKIERALLNLLTNAVKHTDKDDEISVSIYNDLKQEYIFISVSDTGIGLKEDKQEMIFDKLSQVDETFSRNNEGLGIGLTIVREIIKMHGGEIILKSEYGKGSKFIVKIPNKKIDNEIEKHLTYIYNDLNNVEIEFADIYES